MATIAKIKTKSGIKYKAVIRFGRRSRSKTFMRRSAAVAWAKEIEKDNELAVALGKPGARITIRDLCFEYVEQYQGRDDTRMFRINFWADKLGKLKLTDVKPYHIKQALKEYSSGMALGYGGIGPDCRVKTRSLNKPRSAASRNRMLAALGALYAYARDQEYCSINPCSEVKALPGENKRRRYLSDEERDRLLKACRQSDYDRLILLVTLALTTGCRLGEMLGLRWSDIDFEARKATLETTKNGDPRVVPLPQPAINELKRFREIGSGWVFPGKRRRSRPFDGWRRHWAQALKRAGITDFRFHDLRHSVASVLCDQGCSLAQIGEILGHRSAQTTLRYSHLRTEKKRQIMDEAFGDIEGGER